MDKPQQTPVTSSLAEEHKSPFDIDDSFPELSGIRDGILSQRQRTLEQEGECLTLMCVGESGVGKSTLLQNIFSKKFTDKDYQPSDVQPTVGIKTSVLNVEVDGVPFSLQTIDTPGYGDVLDVQRGFNQIVNFIDRLYEMAMKEEMKSKRDGELKYEHLGVDVILYFVAPHRLKGLDMEMLRMLQGRAAIIPVLSKADTMTLNELRSFKAHVETRLEEEGIAMFHKPLAIISSPYVVSSAEGAQVIGREYLWGTAECDKHSDLPQLRRILIAEGLHDLQKSKRRHYEQFRARKLRQLHGNFALRIVRFTLRTIVQAGVLAGTVYALHKGAEKSGLYDTFGGGGLFSGKEIEPPPQQKGWRLKGGNSSKSKDGRGKK